MLNRAKSRGVSLIAAAALLVVGGLLAAAGSRDSSATIVGITSAGEESEMLVRIWSDGRCEYAWVIRGAPARLVEDWKPLEARR